MGGGGSSFHLSRSSLTSLSCPYSNSFTCRAEPLTGGAKAHATVVMAQASPMLQCLPHLGSGREEVAPLLPRLLVHGGCCGG